MAAIARWRSASAGSSACCGVGAVARAWVKFARCTATSPARKPLRLQIDGLAVGADRALEGFRRDRQPFAARDDPEHDGIDHRAALLRQRFHVEEEMLERMVLDRLGQPRAVVAPVAHRHPLHHQVGAGGRGDHQGAIGGDEARRDGAAGFHELARQHHVDVADPGCERQNRTAAAEVARRHRHDLDVIGGGAGALGDAGDRRRLHGKAAAATPRRRSSP